MSTAIIEVDNHLFEPVSITPNQDIIRSSPYAEPDHLLDLNTLEYEYKVLALALAKFTVTTPNYALEPYETSFNIDDIIARTNAIAHELTQPLKDFKVYIVAFRSRLRQEIRISAPKRQMLGEIDKASHREANLSGGLIKYFFGVPDALGNNVATCWWTNASAAKLGGGGKAHSEGINIVRNWYEKWQVEQYSVEITDNASSYVIIKL